jgi:hypothetical protein
MNPKITIKRTAFEPKYFQLIHRFSLAGLDVCTMHRKFAFQQFINDSGHSVDSDKKRERGKNAQG